MLKMFFAKYYIVILAIAIIAIVPPVLRLQTYQAKADTVAGQAQITQEQPVTAVMFYSNWCGACQILDPKIEAVKPAFADRNVDFVKFNFSYALVRGKALQDLAEEKNLTKIYAKNKGKTGFMLLVDPVNEKVMDVITIRDSKDSIAAKLEKALHRDVAVSSAGHTS